MMATGKFPVKLHQPTQAAQKSASPRNLMRRFRNMSVFFPLGLTMAEQQGGYSS